MFLIDIKLIMSESSKANQLKKLMCLGLGHITHSVLP